MIKLFEKGAYLINGKELVEDNNQALLQVESIVGHTMTKDQARRGTITYNIIEAHNQSDDPENLSLTFDSLTSHDITYVGIIQTARASGMKKFPMPYVLTNCHNSLGAVGGTINEDDHKFALSAAKKYGGIYVPSHLSVIHSYNREMMAGCGKMILGSDSHTRYGALGTMAVGEGGGELVKQLVGRTYDLKRPEVVAIYLSGKVPDYVGPHDVALQIIGKTFKNGYVKNKVMEFIGDGVEDLSVEFRNGIDVMTTETTCWSSIWKTDDPVEQYLQTHNRANDYTPLRPKDIAYYDGVVVVDLSKIKPSIALPFHPSNVYTIDEFKANAELILREVEDKTKDLYGDRVHVDLLSKLKDGAFYVDQGVVAGCAGGTFDNLIATAEILDGHSVGNGPFALSIYPGSQPLYKELVKLGAVEKMMDAGAIMRTAICGPCFGAGDTPANNEFSIRHTTRNFPNREGSKPSDGQVSFVALMDARSIAATAINGGKLTSAEDLVVESKIPKYYFDEAIYAKRNYDGRQEINETSPLVVGPNIKDWPDMPALKENLLLKVVSYITDEVTTTDELIPSGETSAYRSNPYKLADFTLSRVDPEYVDCAKAVYNDCGDFEAGNYETLGEIAERAIQFVDLKNTSYGSTIFAKKPGDGSAREHAASCQKVLGAWGNIACEYATKRYRSNLINWGIVPFIIKDLTQIAKEDYILIPNIIGAIQNDEVIIKAYVLNETVQEIELFLGQLTASEKEIIISGNLINYHKSLLR